MDSISISLPKAFLYKNIDSKLLSHQEKTLDKLKSSDIVINDTQTGSGKTLGALLYLKELYTEYKDQYHAVLYIAPVNSLISEKTEDIYAFLKENNLNYNVFPITSYTMKEIKKACKKDRFFTGKGYSNGELLTLFFKDPVSILPNLSDTLKSYLKINEDMDYRTKPFFYLINPDILYYAMFSDYYDKHKQNIHLEMLNNVRYIIFDEFHYYTYFQLSSFFALLSYWKIMGQFNSNKKIKVCLLSATPNQFIYETIEKKIGLHLEIVNNRTLPASIGSKIPFLSNVNLYINKISSKTNFQNAMLSVEVKKRISQYVKKEKYGLIVCNSIRAANELYDYFNSTYPNTFAKITGAINENDRKIAVNSQIIISTSTVDLGFNFKRAKQPDRQNLDFLFIDHFTYDDFVQRLGRGGRILGKSITDQDTDAFLFLHNSKFTKCKNLLDSKDISAMTRFQILESLKDAFPEKNYYLNYFKKYGYFIAHSFVNMFRKYSLAQNFFVKDNSTDMIVDEVMVTWENMLNEVYCVEQHKSRLNRLEHLNNLSKKKSFEELSEKNKQSLAYYWLNDGDYRSSDGELNGIETMCSNIITKSLPLEVVHEKIKKYAENVLDDWTKAETFCKAYKNCLGDYLRFQRLFFKTLKNNFRSSDDVNLTVHIEDPKELLGSKHIDYNLFHIIRYYDYNIKIDNEKNPKIEILSRLDNYRTFYFQLDFRKESYALTRNVFENGSNSSYSRQFLWRLIHFKNETLNGRPGSLELIFDNMPPKRPQALRRKLMSDLIGYIVPENWGYLRNNNLLRLSPNKLKVLFPKTNTETYFLFLGKNALIAHSIITEKQSEKEK